MFDQEFEEKGVIINNLRNTLVNLQNRQKENVSQVLPIVPRLEQHKAKVNETQNAIFL